MRFRFLSVFAALAFCSASAWSAQATQGGPEAGARTYAQNYKDMVLASCLADAYQNDKAGNDIGSSYSALRDWTYFDMDQSTAPRADLIKKYLDRDYSNPLAEAEAKGIKFDFLKCLDLYHSDELDAQVKKYVIDPEETYRSKNQKK